MTIPISNPFCEWLQRGFTLQIRQPKDTIKPISSRNHTLKKNKQNRIYNAPTFVFFQALVVSQRSVETTNKMHSFFHFPTSTACLQWNKHEDSSHSLQSNHVDSHSLEIAQHNLLHFFVPSEAIASPMYSNAHS